MYCNSHLIPSDPIEGCIDDYDPESGDTLESCADIPFLGDY